MEGDPSAFNAAQELVKFTPASRAMFVSLVDIFERTSSNSTEAPAVDRQIATS